MNQTALSETNAALAVLMREKLGVGGEDQLEVKLRRAGRLLPRAVRKDANYLVEMEKLAQHPKLSRQIDGERLNRAQAHLRNHLDTIDPADRRKGRILGIVAPLAFNLLLIAAALIVWMAWSGRL
ncbi:hypothetical protein [Tropicimonas marinistellae]|uniref:hypothetical protein n=1 Tax=Tropicimonas marinistellae TaxID=1739787 RepID=UPI00083065E4|nr:hypothetical protein [Tropicimonas marinistellae]